MIPFVRWLYPQYPDSVNLPPEYFINHKDNMMTLQSERLYPVMALLTRVEYEARRTRQEPVGTINQVGYGKHAS